MEHYVYKITNLKNNKIYIGVRSHCNPSLDTYMGSSKVLSNVIKIEGLENFKKEILKQFLTREEAELFEAELLTESFCNDPNTYNLTSRYDHTVNFRKDLWYDYYYTIREQYSQGTSLSSLAEKYNCDPTTIKKVVGDILRTSSEAQNLRYRYYKTSGARDLKLDEKIDEIIKLYLVNKWSLIRIATFLNTEQGSIKRRLVEKNIQLRSHQQSQELRTTGRILHKCFAFKEEIKNKFKTGINIPTLAKEYKADYATIKKLLNN